MTREENLHWLDVEIRTWEDDCKSKHPIKEALHAARKALEQELRKGHWVTRPHVFGVTYCSECGFELRTDNTNFCPNCGADMREGEE